MKIAPIKKNGTFERWNVNVRYTFLKKFLPFFVGKIVN
jgi:hypothetical protein